MGFTRVIQARSSSSNSSASRTRRRTTDALVDNRAEGETARQRRALADTSPQVQDAERVQHLADASQRQLPDRLRHGLEQLSGVDLSDVRVHYESAAPARIGALAYTQGRDIHLGPGHERHLPHEGWHAVQQLRGEVVPTGRVRSMALNDDIALEREADTQGARAAALARSSSSVAGSRSAFTSTTAPATATVQRVLDGEAARVAFREVIAMADEMGRRWPIPQEFTDARIDDFASAAADDLQVLATIARRKIDEDEGVQAGWRVGRYAGAVNLFKRFYRTMGADRDNWRTHLATLYRGLTEGQVLGEYNHRGAYLALRYVTAQYGLPGPNENLIGVHVNRGLPSGRKALAEAAIADAYPE